MTKYGAKKTEVDGFVFDSRAEARRYGELKLLEKAGEITEIELQPQFPCTVNGKHVCTYIADFRYIKHGIVDVSAPDPNSYGREIKVGTKKGMTIVVEDVKGMKTPMYILKKKLVEALYGIKITEIT